MNLGGLEVVDGDVLEKLKVANCDLVLPVTPDTIRTNWRPEQSYRRISFQSNSKVLSQEIAELLVENCTDPVDFSCARTLCPEVAKILCKAKFDIDLSGLMDVSEAALNHLSYLSNELNLNDFNRGESTI